MLVQAWTLDALVEEYKQHQRRTRGLREQTLDGYERLVRSFVRAALGEDPIDLSRLGSGDVVGFVVAMQARFSPCSMKAVRTALRSFFRFLQFEGLCDDRLELAVPRVAPWRLSTLPRYLSDGELVRLLASLDRSAPCGRRDRAIVLCLASLGLRPGEVANLRLEDIDWRGGTVRLRECKTRQGAGGPAAARGGPGDRGLFAQRSPSDGRAARVRAAPGRAPWPAAVWQHRLRGRGSCARARWGSLAAGGRLRVASHGRDPAGAAGASLKEVADFLGHRSLDTTAIYAKLDLPALRDVALPWPAEVTR